MKFSVLYFFTITIFGMVPAACFADLPSYHCRATGAYEIDKSGKLAPHPYASLAQDIVIDRNTGRVHSKSFLDDADAKSRVVLNPGSDTWSFRRVATYRDGAESTYVQVSSTARVKTFLAAGYRSASVVVGICE